MSTIQEAMDQPQADYDDEPSAGASSRDTAVGAVETFYKSSQPRNKQGEWSPHGGGGGGGGGGADAGGDSGGGGGGGGITGDKADDYVKKFTPETSGSQKRALENYAYDSEKINGKLREKKQAKTFNPDARAIDTVFDFAPPLEQPITTHRGLTNWKTAFGTKDPAGLVGAEITDHGYMSTSAYEKSAKSFVGGSGSGALVNITVPAGKKAISMNAARGPDSTGYSSEKEILLPRGSKLKINATRMEGSQLIVDAEVV